MSTPTLRLRSGAVALAAAGVLFVLYPAVRPWQDESTVAGATTAMSSGAWIASHSFAMLGFILLALSLLAIRRAVAQTPAEPAARAALITGWVGIGLTIPYYGAETFGLHAIATAAAEGSPLDLLALVDAVRYQPVAVTSFGVGLLLLATAGALTAVAMWRSRIFPRYRGVPLALGLALFLPQFFTPAPVRVAHGTLVAAGAAWAALALWSAAARPDRSTRKPLARPAEQS